MSARASEIGAVGLLASALTVVMAMPVLRAPSERIFGMEIVGRHHDPFTVMERFQLPIRMTAFLQPITDLPGALLAHYIGSVAAYNALVLVSFPLSAMAAFLLARHCALSPISAAGVGLAAAFSPFHIAQAAYHPHIAQLQWLPLYLLVLWRCLDSAKPLAIVVLMAVTVAATLANYYGGFIAATITPVAVAAYWLFKMRREAASTRRLAVTSAALLGMALAGAGYALFVAGDIVRGDTLLGYAGADLSRYSARGWDYVRPAVAQPWFGSSPSSAGEPGLLERQLSVGWGLIALGSIAVTAWIRGRSAEPGLWPVPILAAVAIVALLCSFAPTSLFYDMVPVFRSYARFGGVVQLMIAMLAGIGLERLWRTRSGLARITAVALITLAAAEYAVWPPALWRDVLPTAAHRWVAQQPLSTRALDCHPYSPEAQSVHWLSGGRVMLRPRAVADCRQPGVLATLAATGFTHMLVRNDSPEGRWFAGQPPPAGLRMVRSFADSKIFAVTEAPSLIRTTNSQAFYPLEHGDGWSWRWMGAQASWVVVNGSARWLLASVDLETTAFHEPRLLTIVLDGTDVQQVVIDPRRASRRIGPLTLAPGDHTLVFRAGSPAIADDVIHNGDPRALSIAFGEWRWSVEGGQR